MISTVLSAFLLAGTTPVAAPVPPAKPPKAARKICKREIVTTSLYGGKRVCMTAAEWKDRERKATVEDMGGVTTK